MSVLNQSGDEAVECPLCMEPLEVDDLNFFPCTCGYQICRFCWHRIRTDENGLCPACRKAYSENPADFKPLSKEEISRLKAEKRLKDQQRKQRVTENRKHLANVRVVQKNLVFVVGLPMRLADADVLKRHEYFGKFGKIHKVVINQSTSYAGSQGPSASAYVTYQRQEDALRAIEAVNNIAVDGRTIKTSLGTTKYCSHFMRNQSCPKPDCMYLHDLGDQEASFTKEEMHQGKHQEYERKLVQSLHAHASSAQRKPTPSPPVTGTTVRENGTTTSQIKEAWPSLQPGQTNNPQSNSKESSPPTQPNSQSGVSLSNGSASSVTNPSVSPVASVQSQQQQQSSQQNNNNLNNNNNNNNNNKGELSNLSNATRRGKSNSESKAQAARNKHKNNQNKEKHGAQNSTVSGNGGVGTTTTTTTTTTGTTRTTSRSESSSTSSSQSSVATQSIGQQRSDIRAFLDVSDSSSPKDTESRQNGSFKLTENLSNDLDHIKLDSPQRDLLKNVQLDIELDDKIDNEQTRNVNGTRDRETNGDRSRSDSESDHQREGSTPASTVSSNEESSSSSGNQQSERRLAPSIEEHRRHQLIAENPIALLGSPQGVNTNGGGGGVGSRQTPPPGLHACSTNTPNGNLTQSMQLNHRSIFQTDNNSFFSSNSFQKVSTIVTMPSNSQTANASLDWTNTCLAPIPDSLPSVHSSEDWQAAFGFQPEKCRVASNNQGKKASSPVAQNAAFTPEDFIDDEDYMNSQYEMSPNKGSSRVFDPSHLVNSPASKFMADFQQNSLQRRLTMQTQQNQENCEYIKQNGHGGVDVPAASFGKQSHDPATVNNSLNADIKPEDDLGFDPFHETQKALAELMENEMQLQQQRLFQQQQQQQQQQHHQHQQQQQQQQREREEQNRVQQQGLAALGPQHFTQVHLAHLQQQATHLQNLHVLHQSHSLLSRLPQNLMQQQPQGGAGQNGQQAPMTTTTNSLGQRARLPPPGFPGSTPNHMNSFGLGIPRPAPTNNALAAAQSPQQVPYLPNGNPLLTSQGANKCSADAVYSLKDWCEINGQPQHQQHQHQQQQQQFHHQSLHQKGGWNNFGPIADWTSIDPAIVSSSRPLSFQATSTWQFPRAHPSHTVPHNAQQEQNAPAQHWAMQPPPGFGGPSITAQMNSQQGNTAAQPHASTKLISAGSEIENM